jgi:FixJ family two-component response regulator
VIYLIDDDKYVLRGFQILLRSASLESRSFEDAGSFIKKWQPEASDVLILDMQMPGITGCDLLTWLIESDLYPPVIIVSAFDQAESLEAAERYGVLAYLTKPVDPEKLLIIILTPYTNNTSKQNILIPLC